MRTIYDESEVTVRLVDMDVSERGFITEDIDGHINIYINARLSYKGQHLAYDHEIDHHEKDDLHNGLDIREVESRHSGHPVQLPPGLPPLMRAVDLIPAAPPEPVVIVEPLAPEPEPEPEPEPMPDTDQRVVQLHDLNPYQRRVVMSALAALDTCLIDDRDLYGW